jgi:hypothetical protein
MRINIHCILELTPKVKMKCMGSDMTNEEAKIPYLLFF